MGRSGENTRQMGGIVANFGDQKPGQDTHTRYAY